jgi:hypothetical protein
LGGSWALASAAGDYDVNGSVGTMLVPVVGDPGTRTATLPDVVAQDVDIVAKVSLDRVATGNNTYVSLLARRGSADYLGRVRFTTTGVAAMQAAHAVGDNETFMGSEVNPHIPYGPGTGVWVRMEVQGTSPTTVRMRIWADGSPEPSTWAYSVTDSTAGLQGSGTVGLQARLSSSATSAPTVISFDDFAVTTLT